MFFCILRKKSTGRESQIHEPLSIYFKEFQKLSFKLKDDKNQYNEKYGDNNKNVQLHFYDLEN